MGAILLIKPTHFSVVSNILGSSAVATTRGRWRWRQNLMRIVGMPLLCIAVSACQQSAATRGAGPAPAAGVIATSDPLVLSGVAYTQGDAEIQARTSPSPSPNADIVPAPAGGTQEPVVNVSPLPPTDPTLAMPPVTTTTPPATPSISATTADGYPNINVEPKQPQSKLLTPEERTKLIEELNALAGKSSASQ